MKLTDIHSPADIKGLGIEELTGLAADIRRALLEKLSRHGGHVGPNLGMVEMSLAMHYVFDLPTDKIVYDVSHQSYVHKMLTGRMGAFVNPDDYDAVTGFTCRQESPTDIFTIGHTSSGVSLAGGLVKSRDMAGGKENIIAVVGDGSLSGGEAFEGLDYAATLKSNFIIVVNDNDMSIAENHGGIYDNLRLLRESDGSASCNFFKAMGLDYKFVAYGNDLASLIAVFREVKDIDHPIVLHIVTQKGKGYAPAEACKEVFHFTAPFDLKSGNPISVNKNKDYGDLTASYLLEMMKSDPKVVAITAGTPGVMGFSPERRKLAGDRFVDVGIAEQHAVALASGIARGGGKPFFGVVSSFAQRAYDQLSQDMSINSSPAVIGIFYGTISGMNDITHLGWFDIALISNIPGIVYLAPTCMEEYMAMLDWGMNQSSYPVVIRIPGVKVVESGKKFDADYSNLNTFSVTREGTRVALIGAGNFYSLAEEVAEKLSAEGVTATLINPRFLSGLDTELLDGLKHYHSLVVTMEDGVLDGGFGEKIARYYSADAMNVKCYGMKKEFLDRYDYKEALKANRLTSEQIAEDILELI